MKRLLYILLLSFALPQFSSAQSITYPDRVYPDTTFAPFVHGVASGDPLQDRVIIWTRISPPSNPPSSLSVNWEIAEDMDFLQIVNNGSFQTDSSRDWTVKIDATNLLPDRFYYYRFWDDNGNYSAIGRTKTIPDGTIDHIRFAVGSCSSVFSGYFNAYRRIGERNDIDLMIHLGDYVYDYPDADEPVRLPDPIPADPSNLEEWRAIHKYYRLDEDFRFAHQQHPFIVIWDNHDIAGPAVVEGIQAFWEYVPIRKPDSSNQDLIYRSFQFGDLVDLVMMDVLNFKGQDSIAPSESSMIGNTQYNWLQNELQNSDAHWRVLGSQNMMGGWFSDQLPAWLPVPNDGDVFDDSSWDGYVADRDRIFAFLENNQIGNNLVLSGDAHMSFIMDLTRDPKGNSFYDPDTGEGAVGGEILATSISRGNFDEQGVPGALIPTAQGISAGMNPHHIYTDFIRHGYGLLDIKPERIVAEFWYSDILEVAEDESFGSGWKMLDGENHWERNSTTGPTDPISGAITSSPYETLENNFFLAPNPVQDQLIIRVENMRLREASVQIYSLAGKLVYESNMRESQLMLSTTGWDAGVYLIKFRNANREITRKLVKIE